MKQVEELYEFLIGAGIPREKLWMTMKEVTVVNSGKSLIITDRNRCWYFLKNIETPPEKDSRHE